MPASQDTARRVRVPGHPGIYKRGSKYVATWKFHGRSHSSSHRTLSEARRAKAQRNTGDTQPDSHVRFDTYAREWLQTTQGRTRRGLSPSTRASYKDAIERKAIRYHHFQGKLADITAPQIDAYIAKLASEGLSPATVRRYLAPLRAMFATAVQHGVLQHNPTAGVRVIMRSEARRRPKTLSPEQIRALVREMPEPWQEFVLFLAHTGARISEALAVRWRDIAQEGGGPVVRIVDSKTDAGVRSVPLSPGMSRKLILRREAATFASDADLIFPNRNGMPVNAHNFRHQIWKPAALRAGVEATPHTLRHSLASLRFAHGDTAAQVAAWLGHEDPSFTLATYIHAPDAGDASYLDEALGA